MTVTAKIEYASDAELDLDVNIDKHAPVVIHVHATENADNVEITAVQPLGNPYVKREILYLDHVDKGDWDYSGIVHFIQGEVPQSPQCQVVIHGLSFDEQYDVGVTV